jgi:hypothetical protein
MIFDMPGSSTVFEEVGNLAPDIIVLRRDSPTGYVSNDQLAARIFIYSGPRQVTELLLLVKVPISA